MLTIDVLPREEDPGAVREVRVEGGAEEDDVDGLLFGLVQQVVLDRARGGASAVN